VHKQTLEILGLRASRLGSPDGASGTPPASGRSAQLKENATRMPIRPFLAGQAFEPDTIREMSLALERVCDALSLKLVDDAATRLIAGKIIELAQRGVQDVSTLTSMTLQGFKRAE
jgi:hypothetical protein